MKVLPTIVALFASVSLASNAYACPCANLSEATGPAAKTVADELVMAAEDVAEVTLEVGGITCESCAYMVHTALSGAAGVRDVELRATDDPTVVRAVVTCDKDMANADALAATTSELGYPTTVIADEQS